MSKNHAACAGTARMGCGHCRAEWNGVIAARVPLAFPVRHSYFADLPRVSATTAPRFPISTGLPVVVSIAV